MHTNVRQKISNICYGFHLDLPFVILKTLELHIELPGLLN